jgi:hypothetical protein
MTGERHLFKDLVMKEGCMVGLEGNQQGKIVGTGTIGNSFISINNVWYVDGLRHNFLSISQFCDIGYKPIFDKDTCTLINESDKFIVLIGQRKDNVYKINFSDLVDNL